MRKEIMFRMRVTEAELAAWRKEAAYAGVTVSGWVRQRMRAGGGVVAEPEAPTGGPVPEAPKPTPTLAKAGTEFRLPPNELARLARLRAKAGTS